APLAGMLGALGLILAASGAAAQPAAEPPPSATPQTLAPQTLAPEAPPDPDLLAPLTPLDQFTVQAPQAVAKSPTAPAPVRYAVEVNGLSGVNLEGRFRDLSSLEQGRGKAATRLQIQARAN